MNVLLETTMGNITLKLDHENAPISAKNFQQYVEDGFYDDVIFHRVINGFMIQGGGFDENMKQKETRPSIENEADNGLKNKKYSIAMARTMDPHSASAQFFINVSDNTFLDHSAKTSEGWGYAVFAEVVEGMDVVDKIKTVPTTFKNGHQDVPADAVSITKASIVD